MQIDLKTGLVTPAVFRDSPNNDARPDDTVLSGIVVHNISLPPGEYGGPWIDDLFLNRLDPTAHPYFEQIAALKVSAHVLIRRDGELVQYVPFHQRAWHAGVSNWSGREGCNDFTVGIELEGCDEQSFEDRQYQQLARLIQSLYVAYPTLRALGVTGHSDIAPDRKTDPGPYFDWAKLDTLLDQAISS